MATPRAVRGQSLRPRRPIRRVELPPLLGIALLVAEEPQQELHLPVPEQLDQDRAGAALAGPVGRLFDGSEKPLVGLRERPAQPHRGNEIPAIEGAQLRVAVAVLDQQAPAELMRVPIEHEHRVELAGRRVRDSRPAGRVLRTGASAPRSDHGAAGTGKTPPPAPERAVGRVGHLRTPSCSIPWSSSPLARNAVRAVDCCTSRAIATPGFGQGRRRGGSLPPRDGLDRRRRREGGRFIRSLGRSGACVERSFYAIIRPRRSIFPRPGGRHRTN